MALPNHVSNAPHQPTAAPPPLSLNARICLLLGLHVVSGGLALLHDGSFARDYYHDARDFPQRLPDFEHDADAIAGWLPESIQMHLRYSGLAGWCCVLMPRLGTAWLAEGEGDTMALAVARAFERYLQLEAASCAN